jgi:hypothetical protein
MSERETLLDKNSLVDACQGTRAFGNLIRGNYEKEGIYM